MFRAPHIQQAYNDFRADYMGSCVFCDKLLSSSKDIIEVGETMLIYTNEFPYATWDGFEVGDHLMIIPKRHIGSLEDFMPAEQNEFFALLRQYESAHYSVYSRAPTNAGRTVTHFHTHLLKPTGF